MTNRRRLRLFLIGCSVGPILWFVGGLIPPRDIPPDQEPTAKMSPWFQRDHCRIVPVECSSVQPLVTVVTRQ